MTSWISEYAETSVGNFLSSQRVRDKNLIGKRLTIKAVEKQTIKDKVKPVLSFNETDGVLALNKSNAAMLIEKFSDSEIVWIGKAIQLHITKKTYQGQQVDGIIVIPME